MEPSVHQCNAFVLMQYLEMIFSSDQQQVEFSKILSITAIFWATEVMIAE